MAQTDAQLGNKHEAIKYLSICVQLHDDLTLNLGGDQAFASLHGDPAFAQFLAKAGLPPVN